MLTYITRRILYSIPVLIVSTFLIFTFVSLAGEPDRRTCGRTRSSRSITYNNLQHKYHLDRAIPVRYWFWVKDVVEHKLGIVARDLAADLARHQRARSATRRR